MSEQEDMVMEQGDAEFTARLKAADQAVLASLESGMDLSQGLAAIMGQGAAAADVARPEGLRAEPTSRPHDHHGRKRQQRRHGEGVAGAVDGTANYYGSVVNMHGGESNAGMVVHHAAADDSAQEAALAALANLLDLLREFRAQLSPSLAEVLDRALADLMDAAQDGPGGPMKLYRALQSVAGVAAVSGATGAPVLEAVSAVLALLR
ncbi:MULTISPECIES: hypothetical protein [Streptomyces]|uniref:hypothetical protein n=1 Tax=Streptomyces TaxID=1883 RepID=UPI00017E8BA5|nr:hypothetical protein [Streptomyces sp. Mg1]EDX22922.1 hypothetical protein SSAG_02713 [Streptomyces sp. Mg1]